MNLKFKVVLLLMFYFGSSTLAKLEKMYNEVVPQAKVKNDKTLVSDSKAGDDSIGTQYSGFCTYVQSRDPFDMQDFFLAQWKNLPVVVVPANKIEHITIDELYNRYHEVAIKKCK